MKKLILALIAFVCVFSHAYSKENKISPKSILPKASDLENCKKKLKPFLKVPDHGLMFRPGHVELVHKRGADVLYAYYPTSFSVTILSGYDRGLQAFYDYNGYLIAGTNVWSWSTINGGMAMLHEYNDSDVFTDYYGQAVHFF